MVVIILTVIYANTKRFHNIKLGLFLGKFSILQYYCLYSLLNFRDKLNVVDYKGIFIINIPAPRDHG